MPYVCAKSHRQWGGCMGLIQIHIPLYRCIYMYVLDVLYVLYIRYPSIITAYLEIHMYIHTIHTEIPPYPTVLYMLVLTTRASLRPAHMSCPEIRQKGKLYTDSPRSRTYMYIKYTSVAHPPGSPPVGEFEQCVLLDGSSQPAAMP
jgi:hypothetical protein